MQFNGKLFRFVLLWCSLSSFVILINGKTIIQDPSSTNTNANLVDKIDDVCANVPTSIYVLKLLDSERRLRQSWLTRIVNTWYGKHWSPYYIEKNLGHSGHRIRLTHDCRIFYQIAQNCNDFQIDAIKSTLPFIEYIQHHYCSVFFDNGNNNHKQNQNGVDFTEFYMTKSGKVMSAQTNLVNRPYLTADHRPQIGSNALHFAFGARSFFVPKNTIKFEQVINEYMNNRVLSFDERKNVAVFRGAPHGHKDVSFDGMLRTKMVRWSAEDKQGSIMLDARYFNSKKTQVYWTEKRKHLFTDHPLNEGDQMKYKYIIVCDGSSKPDRLARQMIYGSLVIKEMSNTMESFYYELIPFIHYIPFVNFNQLTHVLTRLHKIVKDKESNGMDAVYSITIQSMKYILESYSLDIMTCHSLKMFAIYRLYYPDMSPTFQSNKGDHLMVTDQSQLGWDEWKNHTDSKMFPFEKIGGPKRDLNDQRKFFDQIIPDTKVLDRILLQNKVIFSSKEKMKHTVMNRINLFYPSSQKDLKRRQAIIDACMHSINIYWKYQSLTQQPFSHVIDHRNSGLGLISINNNHSQNNKHIAIKSDNLNSLTILLNGLFIMVMFISMLSAIVCYYGKSKVRSVLTQWFSRPSIFPKRTN